MVKSGQSHDFQPRKSMDLIELQPLRSAPSFRGIELPRNQTKETKGREKALVVGKLGVEHLVLSLGWKKHCIIPLVHDHLVWFTCGSKVGWQVAFVGVEHGLYSEANAKSDHYDYH